MNLEEKIKSLTPFEVIDSMIQGLKNPKCVVHMGSFGCAIDRTCFGCAATNAIMYLSGITFTPENIETTDSRAAALGIGSKILYYFENAIDNLREGCLDIANGCLREIGVAPIKYDINKTYPRLTTDTYLENLHYYEALRDEQKT